MDKKNIIIAVLVLAVGVTTYFALQNNKAANGENAKQQLENSLQTQAQEVQDVTLSNEEYERYVSMTLKDCTEEYGGAGFWQRQCVGGIRIALDKKAQMLFEETVNDLKQNYARYEEEQQYGATGITKHAFETLEGYFTIWKAYRDKRCELEEVGAYGGTGQSRFINECKIKETREFLSFLQAYPYHLE